MNTVEIENLSKTFLTGFTSRKSLPVLKNVSFSLGEGEILMLTGPNGSGKTTLAKVLSTLILPTSGGGKVCGFDLVKEASKVRENVALVTNEDRSFFWRLSCFENLRFFCVLNNLSEAILEARIDHISKRLGMGDFIGKRFDRCSTGMKRRLAIARAIISRPRLLFLDEPNNSLDYESAQALKAVVAEQVRDFGMSVVYITHHPEELGDFPHRESKMIAGEMIPIL